MHTLGFLHIYTNTGEPIFDVPYSTSKERSILYKSPGLFAPSTLRPIDKKMLREIY
jgi:hypothetical protein